MRIKLTRMQATEPTRGSRQAAGLDLYAITNAYIGAGETFVMDTGVAIELPEGTFGAVFPRSGLSTKRDLSLANGVAVIDADYRGNIKVPLHNHGQEDRWVYAGERVAQLVVIPYLSVDVEVVDELTETERGEGGFGSTGR